MVGEPSAIGGRELAWDPERMTTLRALISALVAEELAGYADRQQQRSLLRVITPDDLARGADTGRYATGPRTPQPAPAHDVALARAVEAFDDGLYYVVVDGAVVSELDAPLALTADSRLRLVRLVALAGG